MMTLTDKHLETLKEAPFVIGRYPGLSHDLCRKGLMHWAEGAWRLTQSGQALLDELVSERAA